MKFKRIVSLSVLFAIALISSCQEQVALAYTFDRGVPADIQAQMVSDLEFIESLQGSQTSPLHTEIFGVMEGANYKNFFETRIARIGLHACGGGNAVACVIPMTGSNRMYITQNYIRFSHPAIARLMVIYHEARHTETRNRNWPHANCPTPFRNDRGEELRSIWTGASLAGEAACDSTPYGSYGSSTILMKNISKNCSSCTEKVRMDAGIYANDQVNRVTNADAKRAILADIFN